MHKRLHLSRRHVLGGLLATTALPGLAQEAAAPAPFSFDTLTEAMQLLAQAPYTAPPKLTPFLDGLDYDGYRNIRFDPEKARWSDSGDMFHLHAFLPGWLFQEPVQLHEVQDGTAMPMAFSTSDFIFFNALEGKDPPPQTLQGVAGFRLHHPLNRADIHDELISFLGASYFRALGRDNAYGLSARGLAMNTWREGPEEFPRFSAFWIERPAPGAQQITVWAALDSPSVTGAYEFVIHPGTDTTVDVRSRLFFRADVAEIGVAPLTSMFLYAKANRHDFDDYRPRVHDSEALMVTRSNGDTLYRPLNNPPRVAGSYFQEMDLRGFGLIQRHRDFEAYQDKGARYHDRPSVMIEPLEDWGPGAVRLVEVPARLEAEDNIVAFWVPQEPALAGQARSFAYRMHWGALPPDPGQKLAWVAETRAGQGGAAGIEQANPNLRKFVIDFEGGLLGRMDRADGLEAVITLSAGTAKPPVLTRLPDGNGWRLVFDVDGDDAPLIEISAHIAGFDRKLTEVWLYQWVREASAG